MAKGEIRRKLKEKLGLKKRKIQETPGIGTSSTINDVAGHPGPARNVLDVVSIGHADGDTATDGSTALREGKVEVKDPASTDPAEDVLDPSGHVEAARIALEAQLHPAERIEHTLENIDQMTPMVESAVALIDPLLQKVKAFVTLVDIFAEIHPYAKIASSILFSGLKVTIAQYERDKAMIELLQAMDGTYLFVSRAKDIKALDSARKRLLREMSVQTIQCAYFIQDQAKFRSFWRRVASNALVAGAKIDSSIKDFTAAFENIRRCFTERTVLEGEIRMVGILEDIQTTVDLLNLAHIRDAGLDSHKGCLPDTREKTIEDLLSWINARDGSKVRFLLGGAGTGKSSVAHSIGVYFRTLQRLGSFIRFDRSSQSDRPIHRVIQTIARDLADGNKAFRGALASVLSQHRDLERSVDMDEQWRGLILEPLKKVTLVGPVLVVLDAFDESASERERRPLLKLLTEGAKELPANFCILITSRPESDVSRIVGRSGPEYTHIDYVDLSDYENEARSDIAMYVRHELAPEDLDIEEPLSDEDIHLLANKAEGLFQWAATICRAILEKKGMTLKERLDWCLTSMLKGGTMSLDELYRGILHSLFESENETVMERFRLVMGQILCASSPLSIATLEEMGGLATGKHGEVKLIVKVMGSLLSGVHNQGSIIRPHHTSFRDFLLDETRSRQWFVKLERGHPVMARGCLGVMTNRLAFNMCGLESSYLFNHEIPDLDTRVATSISQSLSYAACNWQDHLPSTVLPSDLQQALDTFLQEKLLFWFELLSLLGALNRAAPSLEAALALYQATRSGSCKELLEDSIAFIRRFAGVIALSASHAYVSALPFSPTWSVVRSTYLERFSNLPVVQGLDSHWPQTRAILSGHAAWVYAVAYSPDGKRVASCSHDNTVRVWDVETGATIHVLTCRGPVGGVAFSPDGHNIAAACKRRLHLWDCATGDTVCQLPEDDVSFELPLSCLAYSPDGNYIALGYHGNLFIWSAQTYTMVFQLPHKYVVLTVAFSPSGRYLASGLRDGSVQLWNAEEGQSVGGPLEGHTDWVTSVLFSRDGDWIISGSRDATIRMWELTTQQTLHIISHPGQVFSLSISLDGRRLVSGSYDGSVVVWDLQTQQIVGEPLVGHSDEVTGVSFSPDGRHIVSGSRDSTLRIWSVEQHAKAAGSVPKPPTSLVTSVAYSPDGCRILSGNGDGSVAVWDANTGQFIRAHFEAHTDEISCIRFSPNGNYFVTASEDGTLRVWDPVTLQPLGEPLRGHTTSVTSVDFSPDGRRIVSGSRDQTLRIWNADNHQPAFELVGHQHDVTCVAWSPDGTRIASGSWDTTVRLWDPQTGNSLGQPLRDHRAQVSSVSWSRDGRSLLMASGDGTIRFCDVNNGVPAEGPLHCNQGSILCARYSPDGLSTVSAGMDGSLQMWDTRTREPVGMSISYPLEILSFTGDLVFSPDGRRILSISGKHVFVWDAAGFTEPQGLHPSFKNLQNAMHKEIHEVHVSYVVWDGWIRNADGGKVMWVPEEYRKSIQWRGMVMRPGHTSLTIDFTSASYGPEWDKCYRRLAS